MLFTVNTIQGSKFLITCELFVIVFLHDVTGLNWIDRVLSIEVTEYAFLLHDVIVICGKHILSLHSTVDYPLQLYVILLTSVHCCSHKTISPILSLVVPVCYSNSSELHLRSRATHCARHVSDNNQAS